MPFPNFSLLQAILLLPNSMKVATSFFLTLLVVAGSSVHTFTVVMGPKVTCIQLALKTWPLL